MRRTPFGNAVKLYRNEMGLSQADLGHEIGIPPPYIGRMESDGAIPGKEKIKRLAEFFGVDYSELEKLAKVSRGKLDILADYPQLNKLLQRTFYLMTDEEIKNTLRRIELRIAIFHEDNDALTFNLKEFFLGRLSLTEDPGNGLRPLIHYWAPWSEDFESWMPENA